MGYTSGMDTMRSHMTPAERAEEIRLRALYRRLAIKGGRGFDRLPVSSLTALIGPDCAYHLYHKVMPGKAGKPSKDGGRE